MNPTVQISTTASAKGFTNGDIEGGVPVHSFLGIPFAQPPVGELRFRDPQPCDLWTGERDCTKFGAVCPQDFVLSKTAHGDYFTEDYESSEDCLFLNVTTPCLDTNARLPVMFWIHGGGFALGFSNIYRGDVIAALNEVVYVSCNYRLGALGFFSSGDDVAPGNFGLLDQVEALKWVKRHISAFGGDPENITIFGESAGGMSVSSLMLSDMCKGLFHRAICQSGVAACVNLIQTKEQALEKVKPHLSKLGFDGGSSEELIAFLRQKTPEELIKGFPMEVIGKPVIDGKFITDSPKNLYKNGHFNAVPLMTGVTSHEGFLFLRMFDLHNPEKPIPSQEDVRNYFKMSVATLFPENVDAVLDELIPLYITPDTVGDRQKTLEAYCNLQSDIWFLSGSQFTALYHSKKAPTFSYMFAKRVPISKAPDWVIADHGDEVFHTFGAPFAKLPLSEGVTVLDEDKRFSKIMMTYWTNFAKTGNPNGPGQAEWPQFTSDNTAYIIFKDSLELATNLEPARMEFWVKYGDKK